MTSRPTGDKTMAIEFPAAVWWRVVSAADDAGRDPAELLADAAVGIAYTDRVRRDDASLMERVRELRGQGLTWTRVGMAMNLSTGVVKSLGVAAGLTKPHTTEQVSWDNEYQTALAHQRALNEERETP